jgi:hypothetical protein
MPDATRKTISATQASALVDASPYMTRWTLYRWLKYGEEIPNPEDNRMAAGKYLQPYVLKRASRELHFEVHPNVDAEGNEPYVSRGPLGCTRDATIICPDRGPGALDAKCCFAYNIWMEKWGGGKTVPREIEIQLQTQMFVGEGGVPYKWGVIGVWCAGEMFYFQRKPMPDLWELLETKAREMLADVDAGREPAPFGAPIEVPLLTKLFTTVEGKKLDLSTLVGAHEGDGLAIEDAGDKTRIALMEDARMLNYHSAERLGHERAEKELKARFLALAEDNDEILLPHGVKVKIKQQSRGAYSVKPTTFKTVSVYAPEAK